MRGVILDFDTLSRGDLDLKPLKAALDSLSVHAATPAEQTAARLAEADVAITNKVRFDAGLLDVLPRLRLICIAATGTDIIDLAAAEAHGIAVVNVRDYCTASVAQHVFGTVLNLTLRLEEYRRLVAAGAWQRSGRFNLLDFPSRELAGKTFGVIGFGTLGRATALLAAAFGMRVVVAEHRGAPLRSGRVPFETVLAEADVLSLHCPLTAATRGLIGPAELDRMKPDALLVNTSRGAVIDEAALAGALAAGRLGGAALDVLATEPPPADHPLLALDLPNLLITPHIAWAAREARQRALDEIVVNIEAFRRGDGRNRVV